MQVCREHPRSAKCDAVRPWRIVALGFHAWLFAILSLTVAADAEHLDAVEEISALDIRSFAAFRRTLDAEIDSLEFEEIEQSTTFRALIRTGNMPLWNEMLKRGDDPVLQYVALMCIERQKPIMAFHSAARCLLMSHRPANPLMGYPVQLLRKGSPEQSSIDRLARMLESDAGIEESVAILLLALPRDDLLRCFQVLDVEACSASRLARIVDAVGAEPVEKLDEGMRAKFTECLNALAFSPGVPRSVYLIHVDERAQDIAQVLRHVVLDPEIDQASLAVPLQRFGRTYRTEIEAWLNDAPDERRKCILKLLRTL